MPRLTLIGYRGTGKSTVAAILADRLGCAWWDADAEFEARMGTTIAACIGARGEAAFRDAEQAVLADLLRRDGVVATGGGVVLREANRELLRRVGRPVVWLRATAAEVRRRLAADPTTPARRPALSGTDPLAEIHEAIASREPLYRDCADVAFDADALPAAAVAERILEWLSIGRGDRPAGEVPT